MVRFRDSDHGQTERLNIEIIVTGFPKKSFYEILTEVSGTALMMWPHGGNCSFLKGLSDYFQDITHHQSDVLTESEQVAVTNIYQSLHQIVQNRTKHNIKKSASKLDEHSMENRMQKFFEWSLSHISESSATNTNWTRLVDIFNFRCPQYAIPDDVDATTFQDHALSRFYKERGNELMKQKKIKSAITMYSKAIEVLESVSDGVIESKLSNDVDEKQNETPDERYRHDLAVIYCNRSAAYGVLIGFVLSL